MEIEIINLIVNIGTWVILFTIALRLRDLEKLLNQRGGKTNE